MTRTGAIILAAVILLFSFTSFTSSAFATTDEDYLASPIAASVIFNDEPVNFDAYNINGNNYFKLRDLAYTLNGTAKQFAVAWDNNATTIILTGQTRYFPVGGEMAPPSSPGGKQAVPAAVSLVLDGRPLNIAAYNIEGNHYFKLRDIGAALDFSVEWDDYYRVIRVDCGRPYTPDNEDEIVEAIFCYQIIQADGTLETMCQMVELSRLDFLDSGGSATDPYTPVLPEPTVEDIPAYAGDVIRLVNAERSKHNLSPLATSRQLSAAAQLRASELLIRYDHTRPSGQGCFTVLSDFDIAYRRAAENIGTGYSNPDIVVQAWLSSSSHRVNILGDYSQIGVGVAKIAGEIEEYAWVQLFIL